MVSLFVAFKEKKQNKKKKQEKRQQHSDNILTIPSPKSTANV